MLEIQDYPAKNKSTTYARDLGHTRREKTNKKIAK